MTARPPEDPERGYSDYGDASGSTAQYAYGQYGEQVQRIATGQQYGSAPDPYAAPVGQYADSSGQYADSPGQYADPSGQQYADPSAQYADPSAQYAGPPAQYGDPSGQYADPPGQYDTAQFSEPLAAPQAADRVRTGANKGRPARSRPAGGPGFLGSLFDFDFTSFVTPKIIKSVYLVAVLALGLSAVGLIFGAFSVSVPLGVVVLVIVAPVYFVLGLAVFRVMLEFFMVVFRMAEDIHDIRERGGSR